MKKIIALLLVLTFVFAFSACKKQAENTTTVTAAGVDATTAPGNTTLPLETTTAAQTTNHPDETTTKPEATTAKLPNGTVSAPVGGTIAQIVAFYNKYANATKAYKNTVTVSGKQGLTIKINSITGNEGLKNMITGMIPNTYAAITPVTFKNGKDTKGSSATLINSLPRAGSAKMSTLEASGVKSASCIKSGTDWKVVITLKSETETDIFAVPRYHGECMETASLKADQLSLFTLSSSKIVYTDKSTITAIVNAKGLLNSVSIYEPDNLSGIMAYKYNTATSVHIDMTGTWKQNLTFKY